MSKGAGKYYAAHPPKQKGKNKIPPPLYNPGEESFRRAREVASRYVHEAIPSLLVDHFMAASERDALSIILRLH